MVIDLFKIDDFELILKFNAKILMTSKTMVNSIGLIAIHLYCQFWFQIAPALLFFELESYKIQNSEPHLFHIKSLVVLCWC